MDENFLIQCFFCNIKYKEKIKYCENCGRRLDLQNNLYILDDKNKIRNVLEQINLLNPEVFI